MEIGHDLMTKVNRQRADRERKEAAYQAAKARKLAKIKIDWEEEARFQAEQAVDLCFVRLRWLYDCDDYDDEKRNFMANSCFNLAADEWRKSGY